MIELRDLSVSYGDVRVLAGLSHAFAPGSITAVMGPSGGGKTTLLRAMLGLVTPSAGEIAGVPQRVGAVFQEDRLIESWSARDNVRLVCGRDTADGQIDRQLAEVELSDVGDKPVREFSGGMRRRVALVRAVIITPQLLVLDEPFKGLDAESRARAAEYITRNRGSATVVIVTHDTEEAALIGADAVLRIEPPTNAGVADQGGQ